MTTKINPSEISSIVKKKIDGYKGAATEANVGEVLSTADGIVQIYGLEDAMYGELLDFGEGLRQNREARHTLHLLAHKSAQYHQQLRELLPHLLL